MVTKSFDPSKFRTQLTKSITNMSAGFNDPTDWVSTGNYALNYRLTNNFNRGIPLGKVSVFAGESGAGKSFLCSGTIVREAQQQGIFVVLIDSENALDEDWLKPLGVDTSPDKLLKLNMAMIDDVAKTISLFMKDYKAMAEEDRPKVLFVVDSLGMLMTPTEVSQFDSGDMKGDMGRKAKALKALVTNCVNMFGSFNVGLVATNHTYQSQDMFDPDDKISGGQGFIYASSIVIAMKKLKLKEDETGTKTSQVHGIRAKCKIMKSRYAKPFEEVELRIPYATGLSKYSGLFELFEDLNLLEKTGNRFRYVTSDGEEIIEFRKNWTDDKLDIILEDFDNKMNSKQTETESVANEDSEIVEEST